MTNYTLRQEIITGADLTGADAATNRTYTLTYANSVEQGIRVMVQGQVIQPTLQYTFSSGVITFLNKVWNTQNIAIDYHTADTGPATGSLIGYSTEANCITYSGLGVEVYNELLGTGDNAEASYDLDNPNVISGTYSLKYGDASGNDTNDLTTMTETTHYTISKDDGLILLTSAGVTLVNGKKIYASYVHSPKISTSDLYILMLSAEQQVNEMTGNYWGSVKTSTEYFDGMDSTKDEINDAPYNNDAGQVDSLVVANRGVTAITSVTFLNKTGGTDRSLDMDYVDFYEWGEVILQNEQIPWGRKNVKVVYTHGYSSINPMVTQLTCVITAIMAFSRITGGSYDDATRFALGRKEISIGEVYVNVAQSIKNFMNDRDFLLKQLGSKMNVI